MDVVSGAGHDAIYVARLAPAGMIFVPCKDGISHNEIEDAQPAHLEAGCNVLLHAMLERAGVAARRADGGCEMSLHKRNIVVVRTCFGGCIGGSIRWWASLFITRRTDMLTGYYETPLVLVSILVAMIASYSALSLAGRVSAIAGPRRLAWTVGGAVAMGSGIWAMHFIGMLAFRLPIPLAFDMPITIASLLLPIAASCLALWQVSRADLGRMRLAVSAVLMGIGINAMHYTGMAAMRMEPGIVYDPWLFALSVLIAIGASALALWIAFRLRRNTPRVWLPRLGAAMVMGMAIVGMHYTGMAAASFPRTACARRRRPGSTTPAWRCWS
jgi:NO-binding membrane sensor protein with MHYT domain